MIINALSLKRRDDFREREILQDTVIYRPLPDEAKGA